MRSSGSKHLKISIWRLENGWICRLTRTPFGTEPQHWHRYSCLRRLLLRSRELTRAVRLHSPWQKCSAERARKCPARSSDDFRHGLLRSNLSLGDRLAMPIIQQDTTASQATRRISTVRMTETRSLVVARKEPKGGWRQVGYCMPWEPTHPDLAPLVRSTSLGGICHARTPSSKFLDGKHRAGAERRRHPCHARVSSSSFGRRSLAADTNTSVCPRTSRIHWGQRLSDV